MKLQKSEEWLETHDKDFSQICFPFGLDFPIPTEALSFFIEDVKGRGLVFHSFIAYPHTGDFIGTQQCGWHFQSLNPSLAYLDV